MYPLVRYYALSKNIICISLFRKLFIDINFTADNSKKIVTRQYPMQM